MSWKGILRRGGVNLTGPDGSNDWNFEGIVNARNIVSRFAGSHFHVDSNHTNASDASGYGKRKDKPYATINYAAGQCAVNNADVIWAHAGHVEAIVAPAGLRYSIEGITIVFLGNGDDQAKITFGTDVDADMDVDADNITMINPRFESAIDALTGPIDVNKANFTIINGEYYDAANKAATDCIVAIAAAKGLTIDGWKYYESTTGTQKESNIQLNGVDDLVLRNIDIRGDFDSSNIENITDALLNVRLEEIYLDNLAPGPVAAMKLDSNCDGFAINVNCRVASGTTYLSDDSDINWGPDCRGYAADGGSGEPLGTSPAGGVEAKIDVIDGYHDVPTKNASTDTVMRDVVGKKEDSAATGAVSEEESIIAYVKQAVTEGIARDAVIGALNTAAAAGVVTNADLLMAYVKQLVTEALKIDEVALDTPVTNSLAAFIASGGAGLGQDLPDSTSLVDIIGDYTGPHDGTALDDNIKAALDIIAGYVDNIDHLMELDSAAQAYPVNAAEDSVIAKMLCKGDPAVLSSYNCVTDSQEMLSDKIGAYSGDGGAVIDDSIKAELDLIEAQTDDIGALGAGLTDLGGMSTGMKGEVQDECEDALEGEDLDHLMKLDDAGQAYPVNVANDSVIAKMLCKGDPATINTYDCQTDSQEMLSDKLGGYSGDGGAAIDDSVKAELDLIEAQTDDIGTAGAGLTDLGGMSTAMKAEVEAECVDAVVAIPKCIEKSDGAVLSGADDLFVITGGPVRAKITGIVTTVLVGASNGKLQITTTEPAATVELNAGAVAIDADAAGVSYRNVAGTSVFTPVDAGAVIIDPVTVEDCEFLLPIGTVKFHSSAAQTGVIKWYMTYVPLSPNSVVAAA